ncbi:YcjF family protein [Thalassospira lucentensis]|uniref:YcjF family protein n=1 Tax=Thalassospira lucentensis TaxID=168935 RepID=UPI0003B4CB2C|nr:DUF697 domain-containing protein [Thalassospira lucentensis]
MGNARLEQLKRNKQKRLAGGIVRRNTLWAAGTGLIPIPVLDSTAVVAVQLKMLAELSSLYNVDFRKSSGQAVIATMMTSITGGVLGKSFLATGIFSGLSKALPVLGASLSILTMPGFNAAFTYALGRVFVMHYAAGGTLKDFDPKQAEPYFKEKFKEGFTVVKDAKAA